MEQPLVLRGHELAVLSEQPLGPEHHHRVVERPRPFGLALVDADHRVDVARTAHGRELVDQRTRHVDRAQPHPLPQLVRAAERGRCLGPCIGGVQRDEALRQHRELGAGVRGLPEQAHRFRDAALGVEYLRRRLDRGDADGSKNGHSSRSTYSRIRSTSTFSCDIVKAVPRGTPRRSRRWTRLPGSTHTRPLLRRAPGRHAPRNNRRPERSSRRPTCR